MAAAEVQHPVPTAAVHDGSCFQEEENHKISAVHDDVHVPATEVKDHEAPCAEEVEVQHADDGVSNEETTKGHQEQRDNSNDNPRDEAATDDERLMQAVAQEVESKLGIIQDDVVVESAHAATADDEGAKLPERRPAENVPRKAAAAAANAVVVPVDDDGEDGLAVGEAVAAPAEPAAEAAPCEEEAHPKTEDDEGAGKQQGEEELQEKAHE